MAGALAKAVCHGVLFLSVAATCAAAPITYFFSGAGSGTIGRASFTNKAYVIALVGDTSAIDTTYQGLGEFRNTVTGTIQVKGLRKAAITVSILVTTACGGGGGYVGIEKAPGGAPFAAFIYNVQGAPVTDCFLGPAAPTTALTPTVTSFAGIPSTRGPVTLTSSSPVTYQAQSCAQKPRACRKQSTKALRSLLQRAGG